MIPNERFRICAISTPFPYRCNCEACNVVPLRDLAGESEQEKIKVLLFLEKTNHYEHGSIKQTRVFEADGDCSRRRFGAGLGKFRPPEPRAIFLCLSIRCFIHNLWDVNSF